MGCMCMCVYTRHDGLAKQSADVVSVGSRGHFVGLQSKRKKSMPFGWVGNDSGKQQQQAAAVGGSARPNLFGGPSPLQEGNLPQRQESFDAAAACCLLLHNTRPQGTLIVFLYLLSNSRHASPLPDIAAMARVHATVNCVSASRRAHIPPSLRPSMFNRT